VQLRRVFLFVLMSFVSFQAFSADTAPVPDGYHLRPGDLLTVSVWKETELQSEVLIRPDGGMSFALAGDVQAAGHTVKELADILQTKVREFIPAAVVTVSVKSILGNQVFVIGKVNKPGGFVLTGPMDVMQALSLAGGTTPYASPNKIKVLRRSGDHLSSIPFHYRDIEHGQKLDQDILLQNGDTVVVP